MAVPPSAEIPRICNSAEFASLADRIKRDLQVSVTANINVPSVNGHVDLPTEYSFKFRCPRSNSDFLATAREMLEQFLINHNIRVYPSATAHTHKRGDSFAEAFPHFDSKVLSAARTRGTSQDSLVIGCLSPDGPSQWSLLILVVHHPILPLTVVCDLQAPLQM